MTLDEINAKIKELRDRQEKIAPMEARALVEQVRPGWVLDVPQTFGNAQVGLVKGGGKWYGGVDATGKPCLNLLYKDYKGQFALISVAFEEQQGLQDFYEAVGAMDTAMDKLDPSERMGTLRNSMISSLLAFGFREREPDPRPN